MEDPILERKVRIARLKRKHVQSRRNELNREMSALKKAAGLSHHVTGKSNSHAETGFARQVKLMPRDTRTVTAAVFGDPIPGDPRCPWRPSSAIAPERTS